MTTCRRNWVALAGWWMLAAQGRALDLPVGTKLEVRLRQGLDSSRAQMGESIEAVVIAPVMTGHRILIPAGSVLSGSVTNVRRVGLGFVHERARLDLDFNKLRLLDGAELTVRTRLFGIENSREKLDASRRVQGIRSTNTPGYRAASVLTGLAAVDPIALLFSTAAFSSTLRFSDPEIRWAAGAELIVELMEPVETGISIQPQVPSVARDAAERTELLALVKSLPYRTHKVAGGTPSDITNLVLIGKPEAIARAFSAAGWVESDASNASTRYQSLRAFAETQPYQEAPMSALGLAGDPAVLTLSKTLNTFTRRHHLRLFAWNQTWDGLAIFQASATHDTDIVMSLKQRTITHEIDSNIDEERAKVINDLAFTGCVDGSEWVARPWIEPELFNGSGQKIETNRSIAVIRLNDCNSPNDAGIGRPPAAVDRGSLLERGVRQAVLRLRNDVLRGNLIWQGTSWAYRIGRLLRKSQAPMQQTYSRQTLLGPSIEPLIGSNESEDGGSMIAPMPDKVAIPRQARTLAGDGDWGVPTVELGFSFGTSLFCQSTTGEEAWILNRQKGAMSVALTAGNQIRPGWAAGGTVTVHATPRISHELGFHYLRGSFQIGLQRSASNSPENIPGLVEQRTGLLTRQFGYATIFHLRKSDTRWRPYLAAGSALQLVHLTSAPFRDNPGVFRLGLSNVGMIRSAYNFGSAPPLDGGGIFQPAVQFGGGIKYRYRNCWILRVDYRNTVSSRPDLLKKSLATVVDDIAPNEQVRTHHWFTQQRVTVGLSFTF